MIPKVIVGALLLIGLVVVTYLVLPTRVDPQVVCENLKVDEVCVCTDDVPISACSVEKKL